MEISNTGNPGATYNSSGAISSKSKKNLGRVYVWEAPVRIFHWINAISIVLLMLTGIYIGNPFFSPTVPEEAYYSNIMNWVRYIHFFAAFAFTGNLIFRFYWAFKGNQYARPNPLKKNFWKQVVEATKYYLFLPNKKEHSPGHNKLAELTYLIFIGLGSIIMVLTGFYLYLEPQFASVPFEKVAFLFGGDSFSVRSFHHIVAWFFVVFIVIHLYMVIRDDWLNRNGTLSSIFTGYKIEEKHDHNDAGQKPEGEKSE
ncbi:Ni/Fe-hydrogenase, b-type cytochrome subunit [Thermoactinomyces sp. AMNI-1]|uniref:Ni/Fe-hydrogenase, b-type cytochrome subunit n=1 Tax=Thermoactinomyces mirandus TaxID=2756294 RepID=A0A7W1XR90_9BACL|nr:Ni/Fe-hydrogenase, b-type cytochrome subunit [Thermoactinomyces mirandus]